MKELEAFFNEPDGLVNASAIEPQSQGKRFRDVFCERLGISSHLAQEVDEKAFEERTCRLLEALLAGLLGLMQNQKALKQRCHIDLTSHSGVGNNPLEHVLSAKHACELLFRESESLFLSIDEAVPLSFKAIDTQQKALYQAALKAMGDQVKEFSPDAFDSGPLPKMPWSKYTYYRSAWLAFQDHYRDASHPSGQNHLERQLQKAIRVVMSGQAS